MAAQLAVAADAVRCVPAFRLHHHGAAARAAEPQIR